MAYLTENPREPTQIERLMRDMEAKINEQRAEIAELRELFIQATNCAPEDWTIPI